MMTKRTTTAIGMLWRRSNGRRTMKTTMTQSTLLQYNYLACPARHLLVRRRRIRTRRSRRRRKVRLETMTAARTEAAAQTGGRI